MTAYFYYSVNPRLAATRDARKDTQVTIRPATATSQDVESVDPLVLALEELLIHHVASAFSLFSTQNHPDPKDHDRVCILTETNFGNISRAFGHLSPDDTENYVKRVCDSVGVISIGFRLEAVQCTSTNPDWVPDEAWQALDGNAYELFLTWAYKKTAT